MNKLIFTLVALCFTLLTAQAADTTPSATLDAGKYPLNVCPISGEKLGEMGDPVVKEYEGREVKFCCKNCVGTFEKDLKSSFKILDEKIVAATKDSYALTTCVVSGEALGGMGEPVTYMYKNQLVKFCCANCIETFEKDPGKFLAMIHPAADVKEAAADDKAKE